MSLIFHAKFKKKAHRLSKPIRVALAKRLQLFEREPFHPLLDNHALTGEFEGCRSINITGDYRAIFAVQSQSIVFLTVGTHTELYD